jgi:uncharacterized membrane protein
MGKYGLFFDDYDDDLIATIITIIVIIIIIIIAQSVLSEVHSFAQIQSSRKCDLV